MTPPRTYRAQRDALRASVAATLTQVLGRADARVLDALDRVPRHDFVPTGLAARAYDDDALPLERGVTISQPSTVALMTAWLDVRPGERVLEIGTGSGYQAAVLCELGADVFSVERHAALLGRTAARLRAMGYRVATRAGDGTYGWPGLSPFDAIVVTAGGVSVPAELRAQLRPPAPGKPDARMVIPVGPPNAQELVGITRTGDDAWREERLGRVRFVPLVRG